MISWWTRERFLRVLLAGLALATAGGFFGGFAWWLDLLADLKMHLALGGMVLFAAAAALRRGPDMALALVLAALNAAAPASYITAAAESAEARPARQLKVVSYNANNHNPDTQQTIEFLRRQNADVVILAEVTEPLQKALEAVSDIYPHRFFSPLFQNKGHNPHSIGVLSKRAWEDKGLGWSDYTARAFAVWVRFPAASPSLTVAGVHLLNTLLHPAGQQRAEAQGLTALLNRFEGSVVVAGDFNMTPFSARFEGLLRETGLRRAEGGLNPTWPSQLTPLGLSLDHILTGNGIDPAVMHVGPRLGSDHLPLVGSFGLAK